MRAGVIVLPEPVIDDDLSLFRCCEPFDVQNFSAQGPIEPFIVSILPR